MSRAKRALNQPLVVFVVVVVRVKWCRQNPAITATTQRICIIKSRLDVWVWNNVWIRIHVSPERACGYAAETAWAPLFDCAAALSLSLSHQMLNVFALGGLPGCLIISLTSVGLSTKYAIYYVPIIGVRI